MKVLSVVALAALVFLARPAIADDLAYNDPAMHFQAPKGWTRIALDPDQVGDSGVVAAFVSPDKTTPVTISITVAPFTGGLDEFVKTHVSTIRQLSGDGPSVLVGRKDATALSNGMPAVFFEYTVSPPGEIATAVCEYLYIDGVRSVIVRYSGYWTAVKDTEAMTALASLYAVAYPHRRDAQ